MVIDKEKLYVRKKELLEKIRTARSLNLDNFKPLPPVVFESDKPKPPPRPSLHDLPKKKIKGVCVKCKTKTPIFRAVDKDTGSSETSYKICPKCEDAGRIITIEEYKREQQENEEKEVLKWL